MIVRTDAVVLGSRRFSETSRIVTLFTREYGRISVIARGAMRPKSRLASVLQPLARLSVHFYRKEGRDLHNLSSAETLERYRFLPTSLERTGAALSLIELVAAVLPDEGRHEDLFEDLLAALDALDRPELCEETVELWFHVRVALSLGYALNIDRCGVCAEDFVPCGGAVAYSIPLGAPLCAEHRHATPYRALVPGAYELLRRLEEEALVEVARTRPSPMEASELRDALQAFLRHHIEGMRRLRVRGVTSQLQELAADDHAAGVGAAAAATLQREEA